MTNWLLRSVLTLTFVFAAAAAVLALDIPSPPRLPQEPVNVISAAPARVVLKSSDDVDQARLQIPRALFESLKGTGSKQMVPGTVTGPGQGLPPEHTVVAGLALSFAVASAGIWLVRARRQQAASSPVTPVLVVAALIGAFASTALANLRPPPRIQNDLTWAITNNTTVSGDAIVEIVDDIDEITLVVPTGRRR